MEKIIYEHIFRAKGIVDGCKTIKSMIERFELVITVLKRFKKQDITLQEEITDDYGFLVTNDKKIAKIFGFRKLKKEEF
jgi:hypothetical protein